MVILLTFSERLIFGIISPSFSTAQSLYTPPKSGEVAEVISLSPTIKQSTFAPCDTISPIRYSSSEFDAIISQSGKPASSSIFLARFER